jgi:deazaflavin-dependent oxidoreductase (nitroreductase family)
MSTKDRNQRIIEEFRANEGQVGGYFANVPLLLVHTKGSQSGQARVNPVAYFKEGDHYVIIASKGGADSNPDWYYNLKANPQVTVEVGTETFEAQAQITREPERSELFAKMVARNPGFAEYVQRTKRVIPVIKLQRLT